MRSSHFLHLAGFLSLVCTFSTVAVVCGGDKTRSGRTGGTNAIAAVDYDRLRVGEAADGRIVVPSNQVLSPLGCQVRFPGRPTAVSLSPDRRWLAVLCNNCVLLVDLETKKVAGKVRHTGSFTGIVFAPDGKELFASNAHGTVEAFAVARKVG